MDELEKLIQDMDIPAMRRDLSCISNVRWLSRNLHFRNKEHPAFKGAMALIRSRLRAARK